MEGLRAGEIARRQGADPRRHRVEDQLHRAPRADFTAHRPLCRSRRPRERHRRQRLRLWNLGRPGRGRPGDRLGQARQPRRRRAPRLAAILAITQPLRARTQEVELMRFGLFGSAQARRSGPDTDTDSSQGFRDFIENNVEAEALGYYSTFLVEHHFTGFGQVSASLNLLTWLGARTRDLRLGTAVLVLPWHNPVLLAEQAATLDLLSGGRLDFGVGKGYRWNEFAGFCVDMEEADGRFNEALDVIAKSFASDTPFSHCGRYWQYDNIVVEPPSAQRPHPPFWMGAGSERSVRQVAERGYNMLLGQYDLADDVIRHVGQFKSNGEARGRRFDQMQVG